jgi:hypothetical protein
MQQHAAKQDGQGQQPGSVFIAKRPADASVSGIARDLKFCLF